MKKLESLKEIGNLISFPFLDLMKGFGYEGNEVIAWK